MRHPWYAWLILSATVVVLSGIFWYAFGSVPRVGHWLRWVLSALPILIALPFIIAEARRK